MRSALPRLAIVTPDALGAAERARYVAEALGEINHGEALVLLRDTSIDAKALEEHAAALAPICHSAGALLFVPALLADTGHHLHFRDVPDSLQQLTAWRQRGGRLLSASTHDPHSARAALAVADIVYLGPIWPTAGKPTAIGPEALEAVGVGAGALFAIGGIETAERAKEAIDAGARGVAGIRSFAGSHLGQLAAAVRGPTSTHQ